jgi:hypothetical protein
MLSIRSKSRTRTVFAAICALLSLVAIVNQCESARAQSPDTASKPKVPSVKSIKLSPDTVLGGTAFVTGTITLSAAAPTNGLAVTVTSSNASIATVPTPVTVAAGTTKQTFEMLTQPVADETSVTISASYGTSSASAVLAIEPPAVKSLAVSRSSIPGGTGSIVGTVGLTGPAPSGGLAVDITSSDPSAASALSAILVPAGKKTKTFAIATFGVSAATPVTIGANIDGLGKSAVVTIDPAELPAVFGQGLLPGGPQGIAIDPKTYNIDVACWGSDSAVVQFDQYGNYLSTFGQSGAGKLSSACGLAVDSAGNVYVGDYLAHDCVEFDSKGVYVQTFTGQSSGVSLGLVTGVAVDGSGNVYVADDSNSRIVVFDRSGQVAYQFTTSIGGGLAGTVGIALDPSDQNIWVADYYYHVFAQYTIGGTLVAFYGNYGNGPEPGFFAEPYGIAVDSSDHIYVADTYIDDIQEFDNQGNFIALQGQYGSGPGQFSGASGVAVDRHDDVLVTDGGNGRIQAFFPPF